MAELLDLLLHVDRYLLELVANYGVWIYAILFLIVFAETGLVVTPFLPGDSLLFATGALAATGALDVWLARHPAAGRRHCRRRSQLRCGPVGRTAGDPAVAHRSALGALDQSRLHRARARLLRAARRQGDRAGTVHADRPDVRALRRRRGRDVVSRVRALQRDRRAGVGGHLPRSRVICSATCRSSRTTSRSSPSASCSCRCCRWWSSI